MLRVGFEVDPAARCEQLRIAGQKGRCGETFLGTPRFELRIGEGDPQFGHLARREKRRDELDARAQESHVVHPLLGGGLRAAPHARALDVHPDVVARGIVGRQRDGILALAAPQFEHDRAVVAEEIGVPAPFERMILAENLVEFGLNEAAERLVLGEFLQLIFSHDRQMLFSIVTPTASMPRTGRQGRIVIR